MVRANKRNEALRIESALLNKIAMLGTENLQFNQLLSKEILTYGSCKQTQRGSTNRECVA
ncbi:CII family transcriptional regulator [Escherichia coli]|uniref:CII family transcriptional regulator n=1 Tax=Escherichia coli TaxID=562 RepID=UPI003D77F74C